MDPYRHHHHHHDDHGYPPRDYHEEERRGGGVMDQPPPPSYHPNQHQTRSFSYYEEEQNPPPAWFEGHDNGGRDGGTWNHRYAPDTYHPRGSSNEEERPYYGDGAERRRSLAGSYYPERQGSRRDLREYDRPVDRVQHDSPCGPATSIYPTRNYVPPTQEYRDDEKMRAEERKLARYKSDFSRQSSRRNLLSRQSSARILKGSSHGGRSHGGGGDHHHNAPNVPMVEISPGVSARLRGAAETRGYIRRDAILPAVCLICGMDLFCVPDAEFILCPQCHVVNPLEDGKPNGGVGLGITGGMLYSIQQELVQGGGTQEE